MTEGKQHFKRDSLIEIEKKIQERWESTNLFQSDAPLTSSNDNSSGDKFFTTFPYPYMNGRLHLGHCFTITKSEFNAGYHRMKGEKVLFPFSFHCTGMPIKACADKLAREIELYGNPPVFPTSSSESNSASTAVLHSKAASKSTGQKYQWNILKSLGITSEEIPKFADSSYWLQYFPPHCRADLVRFGAKVDWRRSFITTNANPFYDSFVRWQFNKLKELGYIKFGKRHTIYSPLDSGPCMDHDRASGEGVEPQEYTCIKMEVDVKHDQSKELPFKLEKNNVKIFLLAATLRPETMYGQTNVWVGPEVEYGAFEAKNDEIWIMTKRSARNAAFQDHFSHHGIMNPIATFRGTDLIGVCVKAPFSCYEHVYVLPMMTVSAAKGTGVVTSVPSDSPDDYAALRDFKEKAAMRAKYNVSDHKVLPFDVVPILTTPSYGKNTAEALCNQLNIKSQNDRDSLAKAKELAYKESFYQGVMTVGEYEGRPVAEVKNLIKANLIQQGLAVLYYEPENMVMSRSGDECVVALLDQWYLNYGEESWKSKAKECVAAMTLSTEVRHQLESTLDWLNQWACARTFGLGTKLPWDADFVIDSLSDSTIYNAYYTVAHLLQGIDNIDGKKPGSFLIKPEQMTDEVWSWIFGEDETTAANTDIPMEALQKMRQEFRFWYPIDVRVSGKDLIPNHLTFLIYNHVALFPKKFWPRSFLINGHLLMNSEKMSKSTGNFMTMSEAIETFGTDATRMSLADAGDTVEDANFVRETANAAILRLYAQLEWTREIIAENAHQPPCTNVTLTCFGDKVFICEIDRCIQLAKQAYEECRFRDALKYGFFELQNARSHYCDFVGKKVNQSLLLHFIKIQTLILAPITPHFSEYIWQDLLGNTKESVTSAPFPVPLNSFNESESTSILSANSYVNHVARSLRLNMQAEMNPKKKPITPITFNEAIIVVADSFPEWQIATIKTLESLFDSKTNSFKVDDKSITDAVRKAVTDSLAPVPISSTVNKKLMPFAMEIKKKALSVGVAVFKRDELLFDEISVLNDNLDYICRSLDLTKISVVKRNQDTATSLQFDEKTLEKNIPGEPIAKFSKSE